MLVDGGDAVSDLGALRDQPALFGDVASDSTAARVVAAIGPDELDAIRSARAAARARAWALGAAPGRIVIDVDASLVDAHSEQEGAAATWKRGYGFHPMLAFCEGSREALGAILRPGSAGSNTAVDKLCVVAEALRQLPAEIVARATADDAAEDDRIVVRTDAAGATHLFLNVVRELGLRFSVGFPIDEALRATILALPNSAWRPALARDDSDRDGASIAELDAVTIPTGWPAGVRLIVRRERPHPGAQLSFTDADGHRFQVVMCDRHGDARLLERDHRARGDAENRIRNAKDCGLRNLPFHAFHRNQVWLELILIALDLLAWTQALLLDGALASAEPKTLRYRLLHVAGRITQHGRRPTLHIPRTWPWRDALLNAARRLSALPAT